MMTRRAAPGFLMTFALLFSLSGCGKSPDSVPLHPVNGTVTFDNSPLADGEIRFVAKDGSRTDSGRITNGEYNLEATEGAKRVEIYATREDTTNMVESAVEPGKMEPSREMYIPEKYNTKSELEAQVSAGGTNTFPFLLAK